MTKKCIYSGSLKSLVCMFFKERTMIILELNSSFEILIFLNKNFHAYKEQLRTWNSLKL